MAKALALPDLQNFGEGTQGGIQRLPAGAFHQCAGVDHHALGPHPVGGLAGVQNVPGGLAEAVWVGVSQIDKVGGVEGQGDIVVPGGLADLLGSLPANVDPLAALILVAVQPQLGQPPGSVCRGLVGKGRGVACRTELRKGHRRSFRFIRSRPQSRKGVSAA